MTAASRRHALVAALAALLALSACSDDDDGAASNGGDNAQDDAGADDTAPDTAPDTGPDALDNAAPDAPDTGPVEWPVDETPLPEGPWSIDASGPYTVGFRTLDATYVPDGMSEPRSMVISLWYLSRQLDGSCAGVLQPHHPRRRGRQRVSGREPGARCAGPAPVLLMTALLDASVREATEGDRYWAQLTLPTAVRVQLLTGAHHTFSNSCDLAPGAFLNDGCGDAFIPAATAHGLINAYAMAWARKHLFGSDAHDDLLDGTVSLHSDIPVYTR